MIGAHALFLSGLSIAPGPPTFPAPAVGTLVPYPSASSFARSSRRASETRHLTVPAGVRSITPIWSYVYSPDPASSSASRSLRGSAAMSRRTARCKSTAASASSCGRSGDASRSEASAASSPASAVERVLRSHLITLLRLSLAFRQAMASSHVLNADSARNDLSFRKAVTNVSCVTSSASDAFPSAASAARNTARRFRSTSSPKAAVSPAWASRTRSRSESGSGAVTR